jgi:hypothetical protein
VKASAFVLLLLIQVRAADRIDPAKVIDLTHGFDASTIYYYWVIK